MDANAASNVVLSLNFLSYHPSPRNALRDIPVKVPIEAGRRAIRSELFLDFLKTAVVELFAFRETAAAKGDFDCALAAVKNPSRPPKYDKPWHVINEAVQFLQDGDLQTTQTGTDLHALSIKKYLESAVAWFNFGVTAQRL